MIRPIDGSGKVPGDVPREFVSGADQTSSIFRSTVQKLAKGVETYESAEVPLRRKVDVRRGGGTRDAATSAISKADQIRAKTLGHHQGPIPNRRRK